MTNLIVTSIIMLILIWIISKYLKNRRPDNSHCGNLGDYECGFFEVLLFYLIEVFLYIPKLIIGLSKPKFVIEENLNSEGKIKVAFIGNFGTACGIATYNETLLNELKYHVDLKLFAEYDDDNKSVRLPNDPSWVIRCWSRTEHPKKELIQYVTDWNPDIIHFSHEYGIWYKAYFFTQIISVFRQRGFKVISTMHSVYDHVDKTVSEAAVPDIIVHSDQGKVTLIKKGIEENRIHVIPHGTKFYKGTSDSPELLEPLWNTWQSEHTIYQPGFLFGYKGHLRMLEVVARLKEKYSDIHYIIQGSENKLNMSEHDELYNKIISESERLGISENVSVFRGFVSEDVLLSTIRTVKLCVLPYNNHPEHNVRATSGAARTILGTSTPLVVSGVHLFDDLEGVIPRGRDENELYDHIDNIFTNYYSNSRKQLSNRIDFIRKTSWDSIAYRTFVLYTSILSK